MCVKGVQLATQFPTYSMNKQRPLNQGATEIGRQGTRTATALHADSFIKRKAYEIEGLFNGLTSRLRCSSGSHVSDAALVKTIRNHTTPSHVSETALVKACCPQSESVPQLPCSCGVELPQDLRPGPLCQSDHSALSFIFFSRLFLHSLGSERKNFFQCRIAIQRDQTQKKKSHGNFAVSREETDSFLRFWSHEIQRH